MAATIKYPTRGHTYWAAMADAGQEWTTVYSSHWGAEVDPDGPMPYAAALFTTREAAELYRTVYGVTVGSVAEVVYVAGTHYRAAGQAFEVTFACGTVRVFRGVSAADVPGVAARWRQGQFPCGPVQYIRAL